jgi:hypothetical protein
MGTSWLLGKRHMLVFLRDKFVVQKISADDSAESTYFSQILPSNQIQLLLDLY